MIKLGAQDLVTCGHSKKLVKAKMPRPRLCKSCQSQEYSTVIVYSSSKSCITQPILCSTRISKKAEIIAHYQECIGWARPLEPCCIGFSKACRIFAHRMCRQARRSTFDIDLHHRYLFGRAMERERTRAWTSDR